MGFEATANLMQGFAVIGTQLQCCKQVLLCLSHQKTNHMPSKSVHCADDNSIMKKFIPLHSKLNVCRANMICQNHATELHDIPLVEGCHDHSESGCTCSIRSLCALG